MYMGGAKKIHDVLKTHVSTRGMRGRGVCLSKPRVAPTPLPPLNREARLNIIREILEDRYGMVSTSYERFIATRETEIIAREMGIDRDEVSKIADSVFIRQHMDTPKEVENTDDTNPTYDWDFVYEGSGRRRKHRSPSPDSSSDEMEGGGWTSSLFNIGRAVANVATKVQPSVTKLAPAITRLDTAAAALSRAGTTEAKAASLARAAEAEAAAAKAAAAAEAPVGFGTRLMNTASALGNLAMLGANIAAPIYMSVDQHLNDLKADEAQRKADAAAADAKDQAIKDQGKADKLNKDISDASKAQQDAYNLVIQILKGTSGTGTGTGTGTTTSGANSQDVIDILNTITAITNPPPTTPPPPTSTPNTYVPIIPTPPQPPAVIPTQPASPAPTVPTVPSNPVPIPPKPPTKPPTQAPVPPKSNQYRGQGRRRGGVTHASHKKEIMKLLETHYR
jgi:hypothetical protein